MKRFYDWHEVCENCEGETQRYGYGDPLVGDMIKCKKCYCQGIILMDIWRFYAVWPEDICAQCYRALDQKLEDVTEKIIDWLRAYEQAMTSPFAYGELITEDMKA
jgi:hypothetical protein